MLLHLVVKVSQEITKEARPLQGAGGIGYTSQRNVYHHVQPISCMYLGISGTHRVNRSMLILYGSARLLPERERLKYDLRSSLADLRPMFPQDGDLCDSSAHVGWPGGPGRSLILKQICSGLLKAPLLKGRGSLRQLTPQILDPPQ